MVFNQPANQKGVCVSQSEIKVCFSMMTLSENYDILVSLILPDEYADWNIEESSKYLTDWTSQMSDIAEFTVSSQIIYHPVSVRFHFLGKFCF